jgi:hypothetical protein
MKKFSIKAVALAAGVLAGGSAFAQVNLNASPVVPVKFASELNISGAGTPLANAASALNVQVQAGVTVAAATTRYVRFDLSSGVFTANPTLSIVTSGGTGAATLNGTLTSGGTGSGFAVFSITTANGGTIGDNVAATNVFTLGVQTGVTATSQADITARYRIFSIPAFADAPTESNFLFGRSGTLITFAPALKFESDAGTTLVADYAATGGPFTGFTTGAPWNLGALTVTDSQAAKADGSPATVTDILQDKTVVTVNGDFSFIKKTTGATPAVDKQFVEFAGIAATSLSATKAVFGATTGTDGWNGTTSTGAKQLRVITGGLDGTIAIPVGDYTVDYAFTPVSGYTVANITAAKGGKISRNGTTLVAPLVNQPAGWYSRLVLTNSGNTDLAYRVAAVAEDGTTVALSGAAAGGTVKKNSTIVVDLDTLATITGTGAKPRTGLVVTVDGAGTAVTGQYQIANGTTGMISNYTLVQKGN